jgi:hypothetical protein
MENAEEIERDPDGFIKDRLTTSIVSEEDLRSIMIFQDLFAQF